MAKRSESMPQQQAEMPAQMMAAPVRNKPRDVAACPAEETPASKPATIITDWASI